MDQKKIAINGNSGMAWFKTGNPYGMTLNNTKQLVTKEGIML
tara:strand:+ start:1324 stop:1449 length:126 start_codon:yes stop_codon:yes gene_type:complete